MSAPDPEPEASPEVSPEATPEEVAGFDAPLGMFQQSPIAATILCLSTLLVIAVGTLFIFRPELFSVETPEDDLIESGLGVELPQEEIDAYQEAADALAAVAEDPTSRKKGTALREKACALLSKRAKASLRAFRVAGDEYMRHMRMFKGANPQRKGKRGGSGGGGIITEQHWERVQEEWAPFQPEIRDVIEQANWLRQGRPGWGAAIMQEAYEALLADEEAAAAAAIAAGKEPDVSTMGMRKLRFARGARVICNLGEKWAAGTVLANFELPYLVHMDSGQNVKAPQDTDDLIRDIQHVDHPEFHDDKGTPKDADLRIWMEYRFKVGDQVMANLGPNGWCRGRVRGIGMKDSRDRECAYEVEIDPGGKVAFAPMDDDRVVRRCTPEEASAVPRLRFKKGDRVVCNMGPRKDGEFGYVFVGGVVTACHIKRTPPPNAPPHVKPMVAPYEIKLDDGKVVFAPNDHFDTIRAPATEGAAASEPEKKAALESVGGAPTTEAPKTEGANAPPSAWKAAGW